MEAQGDDPRHACAVREAREEVGLDVVMSGEYLGEIPPLYTARSPYTLAVFVYCLPRPLDISKLALQEEEMSSAAAVPLSYLYANRARDPYVEGQAVPIQFGETTAPLWGITYDIVVRKFLGIVMSD